MSAEHEHTWGPWTKRVAQYDSLGNRPVLAGGPWDLVATLTGAAKPITGGWSRVCWCGATEDAS